MNLLIFGASGDLTKRRLMPALYNLCRNKFLPRPISIIGISRTPFSDESFREKVSDDLAQFLSPEELSRAAISEFLPLLYYQSADSENPEEYGKVRAKIEQVSLEQNTGGECIYYLSVPPHLYPVIPAYLGMAGLNQEKDGWKRLVIEKPFGTDFESAKALSDELQKYFTEEQIYRIDHFLGKETVQNILVLRLANEILNDLWNCRHIERVEITAAEHIGVEKRGKFYDDTGVVRDMVQNHLLQVLAMVALEPPTALEGESLGYEILKVFKSLRHVEENEIADRAVFGQYTRSNVRGEILPAYREEPDVPVDSRTATFAAFKINIDNSRWYNVPFYLRVGKRLPTRVTEVVLYFKKAPHPAFLRYADLKGSQNQLILRIQPDEGVLLKMGMKLPGEGFHLKTVNMDFHYSELTDHYVPEAYERLLYDCMKGDRTLYAHEAAVEECWKFIDPYLRFKEREGRVYGYPAGTWGPKAAGEFIRRDGFDWRYPCRNLASDGEYCEL